MVHELIICAVPSPDLLAITFRERVRHCFIGASPTNAGPFFIAMHALYIAALTNLDATEIQVRTRAVDAIWQKLPLPKDVTVDTVCDS